MLGFAHTLKGAPKIRFEIEPLRPFEMLCYVFLSLFSTVSINFAPAQMCSMAVLCIVVFHSFNIYSRFNDFSIKINYQITCYIG